MCEHRSVSHVAARDEGAKTSCYTASLLTARRVHTGQELVIISEGKDSEVFKVKNTWQIM